MFGTYFFLSALLLSVECLPSKVNPGGPRQEIVLEVEQTWAQEPNGYTRTAKVAIPATSAGQKVPVVFHFHGAGGQGNTHPFGNFLGDECIIVAPDGYERTWNIYAEPSKADDVEFALALIEKIRDEIPQADMDNVNIAGLSCLFLKFPLRPKHRD